MTPAPEHDLVGELLAAGDGYLADIGAEVEAADPEGRVVPRSRLLCAALGLLAEATYRALGGEARASHDGAASGPIPRRAARANEVGRAAAMLSLVTKIDDQVIDALPFHGGADADRDELRRRTRAFLAPTLASIRAARPVDDQPRSAFAASLGARLRHLTGDAARLDHLLATLARGWEIQVEAVAVLTSHPARVTRAEVAAITRGISGAWLLMIAMVGTLPPEARRAFTREEEEAFFTFGGAVQRADALADLDKDLADGHLSSWPGKELFERAGSAYLDAARRGDHAAVYALVRAHGVDGDALAGADLPPTLGALGDVPVLLAWIHGYLARRYLAHPLSRGAAIPPSAARLFPCSAP